MGLARLCFTIFGAILVLIFILMAAFWGRSIVEDVARSRAAHYLLTLLSWPARFFAYRSGHGRHALA